MNLQELFLTMPILGKFVIIFGLIIILPKLSERIGLPGVFGLLVGGIVLGPNLLGLINPEGGVIQLFSELGKLLLMFFAGFEINLLQFRKAGKQASVFGFLTFAIPLAIGTAIGLLLGYSVNASVLIGSLMASHTLLGLPIVKNFGLVNSQAAIVTVGATIFTDIFSMLVLAVCLSIHISGFSPAHLAISVVELAIYVPVVIFGLSWCAKQLFKRVESEELRLGILFLVIVVASLLAELIELEGIVGAFLAGIAVNRALGETHNSGKILSVISNSLFIPVFFLSIGFLVDLKVLTSTIINNYGMVALVVGGLLVAKLLAARIAGLFFKFNKNEALFMWSLSIPQVAATLAATIVAYNSVNASGERLLSESMLNAVVVLVVVTSVLGPILTKRYGKRMKG